MIRGNLVSDLSSLPPSQMVTSSCVLAVGRDEQAHLGCYYHPRDLSPPHTFILGIRSQHEIEAMCID